jgi:lysyl-tRNA synthetase class 2
MVVRAIEAARERGIEEISLNFATFGQWIAAPASRFESALGRVARTGDRWFQIESLYRFNAKFFPRWEPRYLLHEGPRSLPRTALAAMWAEGLLPKPRPFYTAADAQ